MNNRILTNEDYQNTNTKWEVLKGTIQNQYTTKLKKETNKNETNIKKKLEHLEHQLIKTNTHRSQVTDTINNLQS